MAALASSLTEQFSGDSQFASAEVPNDRKKIIVHWHGDKNKKLDDLLSTEPSIPVEIRQTKFKPGKLRDEAAKLQKIEADVKSIAIKHDGSGLEVSISGRKNEGKSKEEIIRGIENLVDVAVQVTDDQPEPTANTRQTDGWHMGGARIYGWRADTGQYSGCSSAFMVVENGTNKSGLMTANHCPVMSGSTHYTRKNDSGGYHYMGSGLVVRAAATRDGAIIDTGTSFPFVWTGPYISSTYSQVHGYGYGYVGQELCISGSYSGLHCGNIVDNADFQFTYVEYPQQMRGYSTKTINGTSSTGNGDSGGPAYEIVSSGTGVKRVAIGVISGILDGNHTSCQGVPGTDGGRKCSDRTILTSVGEISTATGWYVPTL